MNQSPSNIKVSINDAKLRKKEVTFLFFYTSGTEITLILDLASVLVLFVRIKLHLDIDVLRCGCVQCYDLGEKNESPFAGTGLVISQQESAHINSPQHTPACLVWS